MFITRSFSYIAESNPIFMKHITLKLALTAFCMGLMAFAVQAQNAFLDGLSFPRYVKANVNYPVSVKVKNQSSIPLPSFSVRWRLDGGAWNNGTTINVASPGLQNGGYYMPVTHPIQLNATQGVHTLEVEVLSSNDSDPTNNTLMVSFTAINTWAEKFVLLEGRTETWCPQCPVANTATNTLALNPKFAVAKFHLSDAFAFPEGTSYYNSRYNVNFTPAGVIDMGEYGDYPANYASGAWNDEMTARANGVAPASLNMTSSLNWNTRELTVSITANFTYAFTGPFNLNVYVLEDAVPGAQSNAPAGYLHNKVVRAMLGGTSGTSGVVPNDPVVGTPYTTSYTYTVPPTFKLGDLQLIGVLEHAISMANRYCVNAAKGAASPVGIEEVASANANLDVYPNPFSDAVNISLKGISGKAQVELLSMDGRVLLQRDLMLEGGHSVRLDLGMELPASLYIIRVTTSDMVAQKPLLKAH